MSCSARDHRWGISFQTFRLRNNVPPKKNSSTSLLLVNDHECAFDVFPVPNTPSDSPCVCIRVLRKFITV